jgi:hypothetical protein
MDPNSVDMQVDDFNDADDRAGLIGAGTGGRPGIKVPRTGYWKPSCGAAALHLNKGATFPTHCSDDYWTYD